MKKVKCESIGTGVSVNKGLSIKIRIKPLKITTIDLLDITFLLWFLNLPLRAIFVKIGFPSTWAQLAVGILTYVPLTVYFIQLRHLPWKYFNWIFFICASYFLITLLIHPEYNAWYSRDIYGVMYSVFRPDHGAIWAFLMVEISGNYERLWKNIKRYAVVLFIYNIYLLINMHRIGYWTSYNAAGELAAKSYSLDFGYNMIFISLISLVCYRQKKKIYYLLLSISAMFLTLLYGSRGAFICMIVFLLFCLLNGAQSDIRKFLYSAGILIAGVFLYYFGNTIIQKSAYFLLDTFHFSSRTLTQIINGDIVDDSGRSTIYEIVRKAIKENPIWGYGAYGDRPLVGPRYYWGYSHSIIYEMLIDFGVILGSTILIVLVYKSLKLIFSLKDWNKIYIIIIIFSMCMRLIVSDTFWGNNFFWMLLALLICRIDREMPDFG